MLPVDHGLNGNYIIAVPFSVRVAIRQSTGDRLLLGRNKLRKIYSDFFLNGNIIKKVSTSLKLENGISSEGIGGKYQGYFLDLTLVSITGLFVLMLPFKKTFDILWGEKATPEGRLATSGSECGGVCGFLQSDTNHLVSLRLSYAFREGPLYYSNPSLF